MHMITDDGNMDIAVTDVSNAGTVYVFEGDGTGAFASSPILPTLPGKQIRQ